MAEPTGRQSIEARARALAEPLIAAEGLELLDVEFVRDPSGWILRFYIDKPGGKVGVEECSLVSRTLDPALDVEDFIAQEYSLEVSSPGLNRPLSKPEHFRRVLGKKVKVKTYGPIGEPPRKNFLGVLKDASENEVAVDVEGAGTFRVPFKDIAKANLEFEF